MEEKEMNEIFEKHELSEDEKVVKIETMADGRIVLCGSNAYDKKYYFNPAFSKIPESIKEELRIICVLFTEEIGGIFTIVFEEDGSVSLETNADEEDILYDEIGSGLLVREVRNSRQDLFEALSMYYKVFILKNASIEDLE